MRWGKFGCVIVPSIIVHINIFSCSGKCYCLMDEKAKKSQNIGNIDWATIFHRWGRNERVFFYFPQKMGFAYKNFAREKTSIHIDRETGFTSFSISALTDTCLTIDSVDLQAFLQLEKFIYASRQVLFGRQN